MEQLYLQSSEVRVKKKVRETGQNHILIVVIIKGVLTMYVLVTKKDAFHELSH